MATIFVLQGCYYNGNGWEDLTAEESLKAARARLAEYAKNEGRYTNASYRIVKRKEQR